MRFKSRIATAALATMLLVGGGIATAAPAQAGVPSSGVHYVDGYSLSNCKSILNSGIREKIMFGRTVYNVTPCFKLPSGTWRAVYYWR